MARLIDADKALEVVFDQGLAHPNARHLTNYATLILREAPTVDAVEVVRCKDCKYFNGESCSNSQWWDDDYTTLVKEEDFCSYGERKTDG